MRKTKKGFTLLELLMVIGILGVLSTFVALRLIGPEKSARDAKRKSDMREYQNALEIFANNNNGLYPSRTQSSDEPIVAFLCPDLGLTTCPEDALNPSDSNHTYRYRSNGGGGGAVSATSYVLWAKLERTKSSRNAFFVACSDGKIDIVEQNGSNLNANNGRCPI